MELDVRLSREADEPWGFRLIGGIDFNMPLTIVKVVPNSPADQAGLLNGDTVSHIDGRSTENMSHDESRAALAQAVDSLSLGVVRGLYDPVLDDYEPIYEPIDPADSDQQLPTEVPPDNLDISANLPNFDGIPVDGTQTDILKPQPLVTDPQKLEELRSLTTSPFILPTKPYRPFSTEPIAQVPPLEDPIILNPNYQDEFEKIIEDFLPKTRFKLPISDQYDPDSTKEKIKTKETKEITKEFSTTVKEEMIKESKEKVMKEEFEIKEQTMNKQEVKFLEEMKKEIDLEKIEMTATSIVDESIEKAVTVAEEIKKEIDVEFNESCEFESKVEEFKIDSQSKSELTKRDQITKIEKQEVASKEVKELVELIDKTTEEIIKTNGHKNEVELTQVDDSVLKAKQESMEEIKLLKEDIVTESESKSFIEKADVQTSAQESSSIEKTNLQSKVSRNDNKTKLSDTKESLTKAQSQTTTDAKTSTTYSSAEQRVYTLGLQTIPNIRGTVHSSYHFDMLLKTFFIHLTDVMVALSRFILTEPALFKPPEEQQLKTEMTKKQEIKKDIKTEKKETDTVIKEDTVEQQESQFISQQKIKDVKASKVASKTEHEKEVSKSAKLDEKVKTFEKAKIEDKKIVQNDISLIEENARFGELEEKRKLSGSRMSQLTEKRSDELMKNMEAVITEFESKSGNEDIESVRERRSRSQSRVDTPVDLIKLEKSSQEQTSRYESSDIESSKAKEGKNTYIAIVESHVYTNKDAILEEHLESSETATVHSIEQASQIIQDIKAEKAENTDAKTFTAKTEIPSFEEEELTTAQKYKESIQEQTKQIKMVDQERKIVKKITDEVQEIKSSVSDKKIQDVKAEKVEVTDAKIIAEKTEIASYKKELTSEQKYEENIQKEAKRIELVDQEPKIVKKVQDLLQSTEEIKCNVGDEKAEEIIKSDQVTELGIAVVVNKKDDYVSKRENFNLESITLDEKAITTDFKKEEKTLKEIISIVKEDESSTTQQAIAESFVGKEKNEAVIRKQQNITAQELMKNENFEEIVLEKHHETILAQETNTMKETVALDNDFRTEMSKIVACESISESTESKKEKVKEESQICEKKSEIVTVTDNKVSSAKVEEMKIETASAKEKKFEEEVNNVTIKEKNQTAALKITKENITEQQTTYVAVGDQVDVTLQKVEIAKNDNQTQSKHESKQFELESNIVAKADQESSFVAKLDQETSFVAKSLDTRETKDTQKLVLNTEIAKQRVESQISIESTIDTPTPATVPPTPLTDEYMFSLTTTLPKREGPPIPRDCTPPDDDEDPHIVKKGLVPHIDADVEEPKIFNPPLQSPPTSPRSPTSPKTPIYRKPGLRGGSDRDYTKEEILEIGRKSSLLASAIDQTIKSIEEYKEEVGIQKESNTESQNGVMYNGYTTVVETKVYDTITEAHNSLEQNTATKMVSEEEKQIKEVTEPCLESTIPVEKVVPADVKAEIEVVPSKTEEVTANLIPNEIGVDKKDPMEGYRPVHFDPEEFNAWRERRAALGVQIPQMSVSQERELYKTEKGEVMGTHQGIVDGLEEAVVDTEVAKEMGKPGITEEKIAELISGESEMLREAHVMGLSRVLASHMHRDNDDSSVDFKKIKPIVDSLRDSEVLKALNEEVMKNAEERKKEERKWTTFLQKPKRPVPKTKFGFEPEEIGEPYKVKIVKQPKPKVAPDYKPKDFNTGLLPWEERALREPTPPPVDPKEPILVPEEPPEVLEAVDPLPESEVPDLEDSGIPLPPPPEPKEPTPPPEEAAEEELDLEAVVEETEKIVEESLTEDMEQSNLAEQLMMSVQNMVDPNAPLDQQVAQMRAQLAALAQLPCVIQQSLELVTKQLSQLSQLENTQAQKAIEESTEPAADTTPAAVEDAEGSQTQPEAMSIEEVPQEHAQEPKPEEAPTLTPEDIERMKKEEEVMLEEQRRVEKQKKELMEAARIEHESRQVKQRPTPRVGKPKPVFGPATPQERPLVLPGGRKWRKPQDAYNEAFIAETLAAQAEIIAGKAKGINFMKYEKPPVSLDHLKDSDTYKLIHDMETTPLKRVEMLTPVIAEADYREELAKGGEIMVLGGCSAPPAPGALLVTCSVDLVNETIGEGVLSPEKAGSLQSVQSAPPEPRERPMSLQLELPLASQVGAYLSAMSPTEQEEDSLLTLSSVTARPLLAASRKLRPAPAPPESTDDSTVPPDGGYGWVVVFGAFMVQFWVAGLFKSYGVLYVEIMETFPDSSESVASWIPAALSTLCLALAPLSSALCEKFSCRLVVFIGGLFCATGLALSFLSTQLVHLLLSFGVMTGIGGGLSTTPGIVIVSQYFDKHRALANGICVSGTAAGSFVFPMLIEKLVDMYGLHGTVLLLGGGMLHVCVAATLYRPPPCQRDSERSQTPATTTTTENTILLDIQEGKADSSSLKDKDNRLMHLFHTDNELTLNQKNILVGEEKRSNLITEIIHPSLIEVAVRPPFQSNNSDSEDSEGLDVLGVVGINREVARLRLRPTRSSSILHSVEDLSTDSTCVYKSRRQFSKSLYIKPLPARLLQSKLPEPIIRQPGVEPVQKEEVKEEKRGCVEKMSRYLDVSLLKSWRFGLLCTSVALMSCGSPYALYYLPAYTVAVGHSKSAAGRLVAISAVLDLCGRLGLGWLCDLHLFCRRKAYIISILVAGVAVLSLPTLSSWWALAVASAAYGLCLGCWFLLVPVLLADAFGTARIASSYGLVRMFQSLAAVSVPPTAGLLRDVTGGYSWCFYGMGSCMVLGSIPVIAFHMTTKNEESEGDSVD